MGTVFSSLHKTDRIHSINAKMDERHDIVMGIIDKMLTQKSTI
jgi:hypothetical protein